MMLFAAIDWASVFVPEVSLLELVLRGSVMYLGAFVALRVFRRAAGALGTADLLLIVLIADAAQNAMSSHYHSITEGVVLVATIIGWNVLIDWLEYRYEWSRRLIQPGPVPLIRNGRVIGRNLRLEMITMEELRAHLRENGVDKIGDVKRCQLESDGKLSVIKADNGKLAKHEERSPR
jgi:uncharacterized membrane protein YcaP (DUF421 family)